MVSTVFSKKQFTILSLKEEELTNLAQELINGRNNLILYPCFNNQDIKNISDLIDEKMQSSLINEIKTDHPKGHGPKLCVKNWTGFKVKGVTSIEHLNNKMFRIRTEHGSFMSDSFELFI